MSADCAICGRPIAEDDDDAIVQSLLPKGLTEEVVREAFERSIVEEDRKESVYAERWAYLILAATRLPSDADLDERGRVAHGRALHNLGAKLVEFHKDCADQAPKRAEYLTTGWLAAEGGTR